MGQAPLEYEPSGKAAQEMREVYKYTMSVIDKQKKAGAARVRKEEIARSKRAAG